MSLYILLWRILLVPTLLSSVDPEVMQASKGYSELTPGSRGMVVIHGRIVILGIGLSKGNKAQVSSSVMLCEVSYSYAMRSFYDTPCIQVNIRHSD
jgi:hypothetical protein